MNDQVLLDFVTEQMSDQAGYPEAYRTEYYARLQGLVTMIQAEELKGTALNDLILVGVDHENHETIVLPRYITDGLGAQDLVLRYIDRVPDEAHWGVTIDVYGPGLEFIGFKSFETMDNMDL